MDDDSPAGGPAQPPASTSGGPARPPTEDPGPLARSLRAPLLAGLVIVFLFFGVFGTWASLAPLASAAIGTGVFNPDTNRKAIQHLEGGIVKEILVAEGARVDKGQLLVVLDGAQIDKELQKQYVQRHSLTARLARLKVEQGGTVARSYPDEVPMPPILLAGTNRITGASIVVQTEQQLYLARKAQLLNKIATYEQTIRQQTDEIAALNARSRTLSDLVKLIEEEVAVGDGLLQKNLKTASTVNSLRKEALVRKTELQEVTAQAEKLEHSIRSARLAIEDLWVGRLTEVNDELAKTSAELNKIEEEIVGLLDRLARTKVRAPEAGTVVGVKVFTIGGVVAPGAVILEIVPQDDRLIIDARVNPNDIDGVRVGLIARVSLLAYSAREVAMVEGKVISVSADTLTSEDQEKYYLAKVEIDPKSLGHTGSGRDVRIMPGMNVEVLIQIEPRTMLSYLLDPLVRSFRRSMTER